MSSLAPWIAAILALIGVVCLPLAAMLGVTSISEYVLDVAQYSFVLAVIVFLGYVAFGLVIEFRQS